MKHLRNLLASKWMLLLAVLVIAALGSTLKAAYWNRNRTQNHSIGRDLDGDGVPNVVDPDIDNDGIANAFDKNIDGGIAKTGPYASQYIGDRSDNDNPSEEDIDDDGLADDSLAEKDMDADAKPDLTDDDIDGDGLANDSSAERDCDGDGLRNDDARESDEDGDEEDDLEDGDDNNNGIRDVDDSGHHPDDGENEVSADLTAEPAAPNDATAKVSLQRYGSGSAKFALDVKDLAVGSYDFLVAGVSHGTLQVVQEPSKTRGTLVYKTADSGSGDLLLDFVVAEQAIELRQGATLFFSGTAPALPPISAGEAGDDAVVLTKSPGLPIEAQAEVSLGFEASGLDELQIQVEKVPAGDYTVLIGDAARGTLTVVTGVDGTHGELVFRKSPSGGELPLDFPAAGESISLVQGSTTFFFGQLPSAPSVP